MTTSIVVSMYNKSDEVLEALEEMFFPSLMRNGSLDKEVILLDDASPAHKKTSRLMGMWLPMLRDWYGNVTFIHNNTNLGFGASYNKGIVAAQGDKIVVLNDDTCIPHGAIDRLTTVLDESDQYAMVGPITNERGSFTYQLVKQAPKLQSYDVGELERVEKFARLAKQHCAGKRYESDMLSGFCFAMNTNLLKELGGFDEQFKFGFFEDTDLARRAGCIGDLIIPLDIYVHHGGVNGNSLSVKQEIRKAVKASFQNYVKYAKRWGWRHTNYYFLSGLHKMFTGKNTASELFEGVSYE